VEELKNKIRDIPDFPKPGILFKDITPLLNDAEAFRKAIKLLGDRYQGNKIDAVVCVEARGFLIGSALAHQLNAGIVPVRKPGKLPYKTHQATYQLEYGTDSLEIHQDAIRRGQKILIVDDLLATGGTTQAVVHLVEQQEGEIVEIAFLIELTFLKGRSRLENRKVFSLIQF
ncbi:MAG: adenine phosphoribosyltransferase, partial [Candidatus Binatia bacterium]